jgi:hypothetical protein
MEAIALHLQNQNPTYKTYGQNTAVYNVKDNGSYSYYCCIDDYISADA